MATKKFSPAQIAAQKLFAERARAGTLKKGKRKVNPDNSNKPMAAQGLTSYRYTGRYGFIMIGAKDDNDALSEAKRSTRSAVTLQNLEVWNGKKYEPVLNPKYNEAAVDKAIASSRSKISASEGKTIKRLLMGRSGNPVEGKTVFSLGGKYFGSVTMSGYNEYYAQVFYKTTDPDGFTDEQIVPDYKPRYFVSAKSAVNSLMRYKTKNLGVKSNPDKAKPRAYVKRVSQATGAPPTKRLMTRRKMALKAPAGYFPNPGTGMMTGYQVICMHPKKHVVGIFKTMAEAKQIATAMANAKGVAYGVKTVKVHKAHFAV
jgi:hypothetical protein